MLSKHIKMLSVPLVLRVVSLYVLMAVPVVAHTIYTAQVEAEAFAKANQVEPAKKVTVAKTAKLKQLTGSPKRVIVPRLGINLPVIQGNYDRTSDSWTLTDTKAQFANMTSRPNNIDGNTFIYGHNTDQVFAKLAGLQKGDIAYIQTTNGLKFTYVFGGKQFVPPNNTSILEDTPDVRPIMTLMTCEGIFSESRRVMLFELKAVA